jgi:hypothetical protein
MGDYLGNYILGFQTTFDAETTAATMDDAFDAKQAIATTATYPGVTYFHTHARRRLGYPAQGWHADLPLSEVFRHPVSGAVTAVVFNPAPSNRVCHIFQGREQVVQVSVPGSVWTEIPVSEPPSRATVSVSLSGDGTLVLHASGPPGAAVHWQSAIMLGNTGAWSDNLSAVLDDWGESDLKLNDASEPSQFFRVLLGPW